METLVYRLVVPQKFSFSVISIKDMFSFSQSYNELAQYIFYQYRFYQHSPRGLFSITK